MKEIAVKLLQVQRGHQRSSSSGLYLCTLIEIARQQNAMSHISSYLSLIEFDSLSGHISLRSPTRRT